MRLRAERPRLTVSANSSDADVLIRMTGVEVSFGAIRALQGVDLEVRRGQLVTLIGANAAGKSTLLRTIAGLNEPKKGRVEVPAGHDIGDVPSHVRVRDLGIALVPEGRGVLTRLTVEENLAMGLKIGRHRSHGSFDSEARLADIFSHFPVLEDRRKLRAGHLSGGELQMLAIARALLMDPAVLLVDEPSIGLAPLVIRGIFDSLRKLLISKKTTILLAEQNTEVALNVADYAYVLERGQIVLAGTPEKVRADKHLQIAYLSG